MGISERREREKQELRDKILEVARQILIKDGQDNLSIRNIANAVEYSPATIYLYFQDKDEIVYELMEMGFGIMINDLQNAMNQIDPVVRICQIGHAYLDFGLANPEWYDIMFNSTQPIQHLEKCKSEWGQGISLFEYLVSTCQETIDQKRSQVSDPRLLALHLWSSVHGLVNLTRTQRLEMVKQNGGSSLAHQSIDLIIEHMFR